MDTENKISIILNPLVFFEADEPFATALKLELTPESIIKFICSPDTSSDISSIATRYKEISIEPRRLFAAPTESRILHNLIYPLRNAKVSYILGNYLGTVALCGMVAEMVTLLRYELSKIFINDHIITGKDEEALFGKAFKKLDQSRKIKVLKTYGLINDKLESDLELIREKRNRYLHSFLAVDSELSNDAIQVFLAAVSAVVELIGQDIQENKLVLKPELLAYLKRQESTFRK